MTERSKNLERDINDTIARDLRALETMNKEEKLAWIRRDVLRLDSKFSHWDGVTCCWDACLCHSFNGTLSDLDFPLRWPSEKREDNIAIVRHRYLWLTQRKLELTDPKPMHLILRRLISPEWKKYIIACKEIEDAKSNKRTDDASD